jgi:hypothetical protein
VLKYLCLYWTYSEGVPFSVKDFIRKHAFGVYFYPKKTGLAVLRKPVIFEIVTRILKSKEQRGLELVPMPPKVTPDLVKSTTYRLYYSPIVKMRYGNSLK